MLLMGRSRHIPGPAQGVLPHRDVQWLSTTLGLKAALIPSRLGLANQSPCCAVDWSRVSPRVHVALAQEEGPCKQGLELGPAQRTLGPV